MGRLFLYSDQVDENPSNQRLDHLLFSNKKAEQMNIGYIPSTEDSEKKHFRIKEQYYRNYDVQNIFFFDLYHEFDSSKTEALLNCDIIHLSAGDPLAFKKALKTRNMTEVLRKYFHQGGTIVGVSGGAVQFGTSTKLYELFVGEFDDESDTLNIVNFEFLPHYNRWNSDFKEKVMAYAKETTTTIYAANDGDGIIVDEDGTIRFIGDILTINRK